MAIREGRWDCTYCGTTGILGRSTTCTSCGRSRPEGVKFYLPENEEAVADQKLLALANKGADWICQYCGSSNRAGHTSCQHCASPREAEMPVQTGTSYTLGQVPRAGDNADPPLDAVNVLDSSSRQSRWRKWGLSCLAMMALAVLMFCGLMSFVTFKTYEVELTVDQINWTRSVSIEAYRTVTEGDWAVPEGGQTLATEQRTHHYNQVVDHYVTKTREVCDRVRTGSETYTCGTQDMGNGFFKDKQCTRDVYESRCRDETYRDPVYRDEPVYQTWYTYEIDKWIFDRTEMASGNDHEVYWPDYSLAENEREAERSENYVVQFVDAENKVYTQTLTFDEWLTYEEEESCQARVDLFDEIREIESCSQPALTEKN